MDSLTTMHLTEAQTSTLSSLLAPVTHIVARITAEKAKDWYLHIGVGLLGPLVRQPLEKSTL
jgi:hypothetical protein